MKIECNLQNVYCFDNSENEELEFDGYQVEYEYRLIDNDVDIRLGVLAFQNGQYNYNYEAEADLWSLYEDASEGIVETIYDKIAVCEDERDKIKKYVEIHAEDILDEINDIDDIDDIDEINVYKKKYIDEINDNNKKLKAYLNNDLNKVKKLLTLLSKKFIKNEPTYKFAKKNTTETIFF